MSDADKPDIGTPSPEKPLFTVIGRGSLTLVDRETGAGIRPCAHPRYILDDLNLTVHCGECKERLEPYAILRRSAERIEYWERKKRDAEWAEQQHLGASCRVMLKRSCFTDEERERWERRTYIFGGQDELKFIRELHKTLTERIREAKRVRRLRKENRARGVR